MSILKLNSSNGNVMAENKTLDAVKKCLRDFPLEARGKLTALSSKTKKG